MQSKKRHTFLSALCGEKKAVDQRPMCPRYKSFSFLRALEKETVRSCLLKGEKLQSGSDILFSVPSVMIKRSDDRCPMTDVGFVSFKSCSFSPCP
jgi:hypothetical protein